MSKYKRSMDQIHVSNEMRSRVLNRVAEATPEIEKARNNSKTASHKKRTGAKRLLPMAACLALVLSGVMLFSMFTGNGASPWVGIPIINRTSDSGTTAFGRSGTMTTTQRTTGKDTAKKVSKKKAKKKTTIKKTKAVSSRKKLSSAVGYDVNDVNKLPFKVSDETYAVYGSDVAEIDYSGQDNTVQFRQAPVASANSSAVAFEETDAAEETTTAAATEPSSVPTTAASGAAEETTTAAAADTDELETYETVIDGTTVTLTGKDGKYSTATWSDDTYVYSFKAYEPLTYDQIVQVVRSVK